MLNGRLALHDIRDVEAFVVRLAQRAQPGLPHHDREELTAHLIALCWELSLRYYGDGSFAGYATKYLRLRIIDWHRRQHGDTRYQYTPPTFTRLDDTHPASHMDSPEHRTATLDGLLRTRTRPPPQPHPRPARTPARRAA